MSGAKLGTITITVATRPSTEAARSRSNRSRMMARPTTIPVEAPIAWRMRATIRLSTVARTTARRLTAAVKAMPPIMTGRRPNGRIAAP